MWNAKTITYNDIGVYAIINTNNGKMYIGASINVAARIKQQMQNFELLKCNDRIKADIQRGHKFTTKIIEKLPYGINRYYLDERKKHFIKYYKTIENGYNDDVTIITLGSKEENEKSIKYFESIGDLDTAEYFRKKHLKKLKPIHPKNRLYSLDYDELKITIPKGSKSLIEAAAKADNQSINGYVKKAVKAQYEADTGKSIDL